MSCRPFILGSAVLTSMMMRSADCRISGVAPTLIGSERALANKHAQPSSSASFKTRQDNRSENGNARCTRNDRSIFENLGGFNDSPVERFCSVSVRLVSRVESVRQVLREHGEMLAAKEGHNYDTISHECELRASETTKLTRQTRSGHC